MPLEYKILSSRGIDSNEQYKYYWSRYKRINL